MTSLSFMGKNTVYSLIILVGIDLVMAGGYRCF